MSAEPLLLILELIKEKKRRLSVPSVSVTSESNAFHSPKYDRKVAVLLVHWVGFLKSERKERMEQ